MSSVRQVSDLTDLSMASLDINANPATKPQGNVEVAPEPVAVASTSQASFARGRDKEITKEEIIVLGSSLKNFQCETTACLTVLIHPKEELDNIRRFIVRDIAQITAQTSFNAFDIIKIRALRWIRRKMTGIKTVPKNGLAIFAGMGRNKNGCGSIIDEERDDVDTQNFTRVFVKLQPKFSINNTSYFWNTEFIPELLIGNIVSGTDFGVVVCSKDSVTIVKYSGKPRDIRYATLSADLVDPDKQPHEITRLNNNTGQVYVINKRTNLIGMIYAVLDHPSAKFVEAYEQYQKIPRALATLPKCFLRVSTKGEDGANEALQQSTRWRENAWLNHQLNIIERRKLVNFIKDPPQLEDYLKEVQLGCMELDTIVDGIITKKSYLNFERF